MSQEKRRFFRINETVGLRYEILDQSEQSAEESVDVLDLVSKQDKLIEALLIEVDQESPKVAALVRAFNQKLERIVGQLVVDSRMVDKLANRVREVNISACGMGFVCDHSISLGTQMQLELQLFPGEIKVRSKGRIVGCEPLEDVFYWRVDFFGMSKVSQEKLIQHVVQRQGAQLKKDRL